MTNEDEKTARIRAKLGAAARASTVVVGGKTWTVHRAPSRASKLRASDPSYYDAMEAEQDEVAADESLRSAGIRHFVGDGGRTIVAVADMPPLDVVELARVGTHNGGDDDWREVRAFLRETIATLPFDVLFADEAGLHVRAATAVDRVHAHAWDRALLDRVESSDRWTDSYTMMIEEAEELEPDAEADERGGGAVAAFIVATRSLRLWWD